ncbi:hypothetical protein H0H92_005497 [Tricholoma furcatifolium]|nr:hypothetical protein H0H92_005497 [Tricholoma furcatifolium]
MARTRMVPPERHRRQSSASQGAYKQRKSTVAPHKRYSGRPNLQSQRVSGRRKFRDMENSPLRKATHADYSRSFDPDDDTFYDSDADDPPKSEYDSDEDNEKTLFPWEDEDTLYSDLLDAQSDPEDDNYDDLVDALQPAFDERSRELKREIAETLVPTVNRVKGLYEKIATNVDGTFGKGIIGFNNACKGLEALCMRDEDELKDAWARMQKANEQLFARLKDANTVREGLWVEYNKAVNETGNMLLSLGPGELTSHGFVPTLELLRDLPGNVERTIGNLEKQERALEKDDANAANAVKHKIKGFLAKA